MLPLATIISACYTFKVQPSLADYLQALSPGRKYNVVLEGSPQEKGINIEF